MTQQEMQKFITDNVLKQGNEGAINIAPLLSAMVDKMFADPETGVDGDALIGFTYLEISETTITGQSISPDGSYKLYLLIENSVQPGSGTITITVHPDVNNNINNNSGWADIRALLQEKTYITIQAATV